MLNTKHLYFGNTGYVFDWVHFMASYRRIVRPTDRVLEIGSSNLRKTTELARYCRELVGIEKYPNRIVGQSVGKRTNTVVKKGEWEKLSKLFPDSSFDGIVASHVIEHVVDDLFCLNQTYAVLKAGGFLIFTTPNRLRLTERLRSIVKGKRRYPYHEHQREYTESDLLVLLSKSKFSGCQTKITGFVFGIHGGPVYLFLKHVPNFLRSWVTFWEVTVLKPVTARNEAV